MDDDPSDPLSAPDNCWFTFADFDAVLGDDSERSGATEGFQYGELDTIHFDLEKLNRSRAELNTDVDYFRGRGHSQSYLEEASDFKRENLNDVIDSGSDASLHPLQDSSKRLRLSCDLVNSSRGSTFCANNFDQPKPQKNIKECAVSVSNGVGAGLSYSATADVNDIYSKSEMNSNEQQGHAISFQTGYEEFESHVENVFPPSELPNGETSSPRGPPLKFFGLSGEMHNSHSSGALPGSIVEDRNMYSSLPMESMVSCIDPSVPVTDVINPESCTFDAANNTCNGGSNIILHRDCTGDVDDGLYQTSQVQFPASCPVENEKCNRRVDHLLSSQNSDWTSNVRLSRNGEYSSPVLIDLTDSFEVTNNTCNGSNNTILDTDYVSDMEYGLDQTSAAQFLPYSDDTSLISESSTDSSPILSSRNSTSDHVDGCTLTNVSNSLVSCSNRSWQSMPRSFMSSETGNQFLQSCYEQHKILKDGSSSAPKHFSGSIINVEDDNDLCILDNVSDYVSLPRPPSRVKMLPISQRPEFTNPHYHTNGGMGLLRADDERLTFQIAMQDLSQPRSEISPPDGVLAVPLLRHQRIALSWMVQKETTGSLKCAGGILADDQGLGKTVSTIALILMERSPSSRSSTVVKKEDEFETLNLDDDDDDDDDDEDTKVNVMKQTCSSYPILMSNLTKPMKDENSVSEMKSRPAAGTLVVCPTSVLRQWADELQAKVTSKANLSFLVYHGSNRTKDPNELAKYDVVLTTYAIVSMEVPKQPLVDKDDEEKRQHDASGASSVLLNCRKRKASPTSSTKNRKGRSKMDHAMLESTARPLGRVGWFRVVLDEAQSIKNHRTQVARACWGLRAKRRWCLSGTPIQNSIDDLYSYFRFLRYDPYAVYQSFCSTIKMPISRNPTNGYKKLQAVLNTIMLRRTKGTLLDGKPIITLPPKKISLKKVDFSAEERDFYSTLEAESREQFMEYEDAGTVKQNYVNILLMLLRLRQACDHPLLVKDCDSNSNQRSSLEMAKKLPRDKKIVLLSCLEVSLAICAICNDPPEDAVVTICGHVFCNQCICAHLTSEENICPSPNCKVLLTAASVFSRRTLKSCLSDQLGDESYSGGSDFDMGDKHKKWENNWSSSSSKIKVALEILQSLPKSQCQSTSNVEKSDVESLCSSVKPTNLGWSTPDLSGGLTQTTLEKYSTCNVSEKAIIFSQWTRMLDLLEAPLKASCIQYRRLDGTMSVAAREKAVKDFNTLPEVTVIIMSLKAASLGLNLVAANHVLLLDLWWNPTTEDQAIDRAHRIGQARPVTVSRLTVKDTVEDKILSLQEKKREMVASAFGEDESGSRQTRLTMEDMRYIFMT